MSSLLRTFFSFEREIWAETRDAKLELQPLDRSHENPVVPRGEEGAPDSHRISFTQIMPEGGRLRAWYGAMSTGEQWLEHNVGYAESDDGVHWHKPSLDLVAPGTNLVMRGAMHLNVLLDETGGGPRYGGTYGMFRPDAAQKTGTTFDVATSEDGLQWQHNHTPQTEIRHFETFGSFRQGDRWWILGQGVSPYFTLPDGREHGRVMYGFHSEDWEDWELYPRALFAYEADPFFPRAGLQNHVGAGVWDRGRVLLGFHGQFWPAGFSTVVRSTFGLIYSHDGITWREPFARTPLLMPGTDDAWDRGMLFQTQRPVSRGDRTFVYYTGGDSGNVWETKTAVGLATLRRDGFAAYSAAAESAELITEPIALEPDESWLYVNSEGDLTVQVLDRLLQPISSETLVTERGVRTAVTELSKLPIADPIRLRFRLAPQTKLYTFSFGPAAADLPLLDTWQ